MEQIKTKEDVFNYLRTLPNKFKIQTKYGNHRMILSDGFSTAINYNPITKLYLDILRANKKTTSLMPVPARIDSKPYNTLNEIIKATEKFKVNTNDEEEITIGNMSPNQSRHLQNTLVSAICSQLMCALLYEDYFNTDFRYGNAHEEASKLLTPKNEQEIENLYKEWTSKKSKIEQILFFADSDPIIRLIEL